MTVTTSSVFLIPDDMNVDDLADGMLSTLRLIAGDPMITVTGRMMTIRLIMPGGAGDPVGLADAAVRFAYHATTVNHVDTGLPSPSVTTTIIPG